MRKQRTNLRNTTGFTLIELITVMVIIAILAAIAIANYGSAQNKAKQASVIDNMHTCQVCSETYAADNSGVYAPSATDLLPFYPTGSNTVGGAPGAMPQNPFSGVLNEPLYAETISDTAGIQAARSGPPTASPGGAGQVGYKRCDEPDGTSYCVSGTDVSGNRIGSGGRTMLLSNQ
jgi:prepilin-type N-terminal cleavage/methylation domain-containing protein